MVKMTLSKTKILTKDIIILKCLNGQNNTIKVHKKRDKNDSLKKIPTKVS